MCTERQTAELMRSPAKCTMHTNNLTYNAHYFCCCKKKKRQTISAWYVHPWITFALSSFELTRARFNSTQKHMHTTHIHTQNFDNQQNPSIRMISIANSTSCEQIDIRKEKKITEKKKSRNNNSIYINTNSDWTLSYALRSEVRRIEWKKIGNYTKK